VARATRAGNPGGESDGEALERRVGRLEFSEGAFVRLRVPLRVNAEAGRDVLTDLDVLSIDVDPRLRVSNAIIECKSGSGQAGEPDRLLWLAGVRDYVRADRAMLIRSTVSTRGRLVASRLRLETMDLPRLEEREQGIVWMPDTFAHIGAPLCASAERDTDTAVTTLALPSDLVSFVRGDFVFQPARTLRSVVDLWATLDGSAVPDRPRMMLASHSLVALIHAALIDSKALDVMPRSTLSDRLERQLTVGTEQSNLLEILEQADALVGLTIDRIHEAYERTGLSRQAVAVPRLRDVVAEPPNWLPRYLDLVEAFRANGSVAADLLQTAELACFDGLLGGDAYAHEAFDQLFTIEHRQLLRLARASLSEIAGTSASESLEGFESLNFQRRPSTPDRRSAPRLSQPL